MGVGEGRGRRETNMKKHFIFLIGHPLSSSPHSHTNPFPASEARRSSSASSQRVSNWILILINRRKKEEAFAEGVCRIRSDVGHGMRKRKKRKEKRRMILLFAGSAVFCLLLFRFVSFRGRVRVFLWRGNGWVGGWVGSCRGLWTVVRLWGLL